MWHKSVHVSQTQSQFVDMHFMAHLSTTHSTLNETFVWYILRVYHNLFLIFKDLEEHIFVHIWPRDCKKKKQDKLMLELECCYIFYTNYGPNPHLLGKSIPAFFLSIFCMFAGMCCKAKDLKRPSILSAYLKRKRKIIFVFISNLTRN